MADPYRIDQSGAILERLRELPRRAGAAGQLERFRSALTHVFEYLTAAPHDWGRARNFTRGRRLPLRFGNVGGLHLEYTVYEESHTVVLLTVEWHGDEPGQPHEGNGVSRFPPFPA